MDRSLYPEGVEVHQRDLERTETTKAFQILQRHSDVSAFGVVSGIVSVNSTNATTIDISDVVGYSPNGELVEAADQSGLSLSDYVLGVINYAIIFYSENNVDPQPHETNGESYPTSAVRSSRLEILSETEYNALPESDNNPNNNARDRGLIVAKIVARGVGINLTSGDITGPTSFSSTISVSATSNITGLTVVEIDGETPTGVGTLSFLVGITSFTWQAPGDSFAGASISPILSGTYVISSSSGRTITVQIILSFLPVTNQTDSITVTNIYTQVVPRHTAIDGHHRSLLGSGIPTLKNPHGLTLADLGAGGGSVDVHQDIFHSNGISRLSETNCLEATVNSITSPDSLSIQQPINDDNFYIGGLRHLALVGATVTFSDVLVDAQIVFDVYAEQSLTGAASLSKYERIRYTITAPPPPLSVVVQLINCSQGVAATASARIGWIDSSNTLCFDSGDGNYGLPISIPIMGSPEVLRLFNFVGDEYIDVYVNDILAAGWVGINGSGDLNIPLTVSSLPNQEIRMLIASTMFSGATGYLGYGFGAANFPNSVVDQRIFGMTGPTDFATDAGVFTKYRNPYGVLSTTLGLNIGNGSISQICRSKVFISDTPTARNGEQYGLYVKSAYANGISGLKQAIRSDIISTHSSGIITDLVSNLSIVSGQHVGGSVNYAYAYWARIDVAAGAPITHAQTIRVADPSGSGGVGTITNLYGLYVESLTKGTNNYAIWTNNAPVRLGDEVQIVDANFKLDIVASNPEIIFDTATNIDGFSYDRVANALALNVDSNTSFYADKYGFDFKTITRATLRWNCNATRDGATNPGGEGFRAGLIDSTLNALIDTDHASQPGVNSFMVEITDHDSAIPSRAFVVARTGSGGVPVAHTMFMGNGDLQPGKHQVMNIGTWLTNEVASIAVNNAIINNFGYTLPNLNVPNAKISMSPFNGMWSDPRDASATVDSVSIKFNGLDEIWIPVSFGKYSVIDQWKIEVATASAQTVSASLWSKIYTTGAHVQIGPTISNAFGGAGSILLSSASGLSLAYTDSYVYAIRVYGSASVLTQVYGSEIVFDISKPQWGWHRSL